MDRLLWLIIMFWLVLNLSMIIRETIEWKHGIIAVSLFVYKESPNDRRALTMLYIVLAPAFVITILLYYIGFRIHVFKETSKMMNDFIDMMYYQQVDLWNGATGLEKLHRKIILWKVVRDKVLELQPKW